MKNKIYLLIECTVIYIGMPLVFYFNLLPAPKLAALLAFAILCVLVLWFHKELDFGQLLQPPETARYKQLIWRILAAALTILLLVMLVQPSNLFGFPREQPVVWMVVILLYPLLSAMPQELIYREYFFQRYKALFTSDRVRAFASAVAFSFLHIVYDNVWAVGLSLAGGLLLADTYLKTRSLYWVSVEHALYGCLIFTIGMGNYFYEPLPF